MTTVNVRCRQFISPVTVGSVFDAFRAIGYLRMEDVTKVAQSLHLAVTLQQSVLTVAELGNK